MKPGIVARLGRNSRNCRGLGICTVRVIKHKIRTGELTEENTVLLQFLSENTLFAELKDFPVLDINLKDFPLIIDEDILFTYNDKEIKILAGTYQYNSSLSQFGGYEITVE